MVGVVRNFFVALIQRWRACRRGVRRHWRTALILWLALAMALPPARLSACPPPPQPPQPPKGPPPCTDDDDDDDDDCPDDEGGSGGGNNCPTQSGYPVYLRYGYALETAVDLQMAGPGGFNWSLGRSYSSGLAAGSVTSLSHGWLSAAADMYFAWNESNPFEVTLIRSASSGILFAGDAPVHPATTVTLLPKNDDSTLQIVGVIDHWEQQQINNETIWVPFVYEAVLTDRLSDLRQVFYGPHETTNPPGKLKERSTRQWHAQGRDGFGYTYNSTTGELTQITTPEGQDYSIAFAYSGGRMTSATISDLSKILQRVEYKYYDDVSSPATGPTGIGNSGDLVQVKVMTRATADPVSSPDVASNLSIVRYTQYRYHTTGAKHLKAVYQHDSLVRACAKLSIADADAVLTKADDFGDPDLKDFASHAFEYYDSTFTTNGSVTTIFGSVNLNTNYGGAEADETNLVKSETIRGSCSSCGSGSGNNATIKKEYYYLDIGQGATIDQNEVVRLVVEDTTGGDGQGKYRVVYGFNDNGHELRKAFIQDPAGSPLFWCESQTMHATGPLHRVAEKRWPSAHNVTSNTEVAQFLDPYDSETTSWSNDTARLRSTAGKIETYEYNSIGMQTGVRVKQGATGTAYYVAASDYGDGDGDAAGQDSVDNSLLIAEYSYPTATTTRADGKKTSYSYTFWDSSATPADNIDRQIKKRTTTLPSIATTQNGSGVATTTEEYFDALGRLRWQVDGERYVDYRGYSPVTGGLAYLAQDIDPANLPSEAQSGDNSGPSGVDVQWDAWTIGSANTNKPTRDSGLPTALQLVNKTGYDQIGRPTKTIDVGGATHYTAYANKQTIRFPYWSSGSSTTLLPIVVTVQNDGVQVSEQYEVKAGYGSISTDMTSGAPVGFSSTVSIDDYVAWTRMTRDDVNGRLKYTDRYHLIPANGSAPGTLSTNYYRTVQQYDALGRLEYVIQVVQGDAANNRVEQVTRNVYDLRDRLTAVWKGVSGDSAANSHNMTDDYNQYPVTDPNESYPLTQVSETRYDNGGVGDGHVTKTLSFFGFYGAAGNNFTGINFYRDFRGHLRGVEPFYMNGSTETPISPYTVSDVDWQGRTIAAAQFDSTLTWSSVISDGAYAATASSSARRTLTKTMYDDLGRPYRSERYKIAAGTGSGSDHFANQTYYDRNGQIVARATDFGAAQETAYDGAGREFQTRTVLLLASTKYSSGKFNYRAPAPLPTLSSMSGGDDNVIAMTHSVLDAAGNRTQQHEFEANHDEVVATGRGIDLTNNDDYVRSSEFMWYDAADRLTTSADYGSGDSTGAWTYAAVPNPGSAPTTSSSSELVTLFGYNADTGRQELITDPAGSKTKTFYDDLGRTTYVAQNWNDFAATGTSGANSGDATDKSRDQVVKFTYNGLNAVVTLTALDQNADGTQSDNQQTKYLFEDVIGAERVTSEIYPDSSDTTSAGTDQVKLGYAVDGVLKKRTDQRNVVLDLIFNGRRQLELSAATIPTGSGVDEQVKSIKREYDSLGRLTKITSYANADGAGTVRNQIQLELNDLDQVTTSYQSHEGVVVTSGGGASRKVQYAYDTTVSGNVFQYQHRLEKVTYPQGREVFYSYQKGSADLPGNRLSRITEIRNASATGDRWMLYHHNGVNRLAMAEYRQVGWRLDYFQGTAGAYAGFDRFGRVKDQRWYDYLNSVDIDRIHYTHDYAGNRTARDIDSSVYAANDRDQTYAYDGLHRLKDYKEGTYASGAISTPTYEQNWTLDALGNWSNFVDKTGPTVNLDQTRPANLANELGNFTESVGPSWQTPAYDAAGNLTIMPRPGAPTTSMVVIYDAWNRAVKAFDATPQQIAEYEYDGLNRRIVKSVYASGSVSHREHYYYNEEWQTLEVRKETGTTEVAYPLEQFIWHPYYIDAVLCRFYDANVDGVGVQQHYYAHDANFNVTAIRYGSVVQERYRYSPYGELTVLDANFAVDADGKSDIGNSYTYTGREFDGETGLYHYRNRYYHAQLGSFVSRDPIGYEGRDTNLYRYVFNSPASYTDPLGNVIPGDPDPSDEIVIVVVVVSFCKRVVVPAAKGCWKVVKKCYNKCFAKKVPARSPKRPLTGPERLPKKRLDGNDDTQGLIPAPEPPVCPPPIIAPPFP